MKTCWAESSTWSQTLSSPKYRRPAEDITQLACGVSAILADRFRVQFLPYLEKRRLLSLHCTVKVEQPVVRRNRWPSCGSADLAHVPQAIEAGIRRPLLGNEGPEVQLNPW